MEKELKIYKREESYKLTILPELEEQIRFLCNKLPNLEYSGTLFYKIEGSFETNDLHVIAKDFYLQDVGTGTYTEFKNDSTLAGYMVSHDLFDCCTGLLHSHNHMATFFSGTDLNTLKEEGNTSNHFVSLIVNNAGEYTAVITRKVTRNIIGKYSYKYNSFNNKEVTFEENDVQEFEDIYIEYFNLIINKPNIVLEKSELELRLEEVRNNKLSINRGYLDYKQVAPVNTTYSQPYKQHQQLELFPEYVKENKPAIKEDDSLTFKINKIADAHFKQIITGNLFAGYNKDLNVEKWLGNIEKVFDKRFTEDTFSIYIDYILDLLYTELLNEFKECSVDMEDRIVGLWAQSLIKKFPDDISDQYTICIIESLNRYFYE